MAAFSQDGGRPRKEPLVIVKDGRFGYINHDGKLVIEPKYLWGSDFQNGFAWVYLCGRMVPIDRSGKILSNPRENSLVLEPKSRDGKFGFADSSGNFKIQPIFDDALHFSEGLAAVQSGKLWGFVDTSGQFVIQPAFQSAFYFIEGVATAETDKEFVVIDRTGKIIATGFDLTHGVPQEGRIPVGRDDKYGYLDLHGKAAIPLIYDEADSFSYGLAAVKKGTKWGYITADGQTAIPFEFDEAGPFASGLAPVKIGTESGFIDKSGKFVFHLAFDYAPGFLTGNADGMFVADYDVSRFWTKDRKFGYVNTSGRVIWGPTEGSPDHPPINGWSEEDKARSCKGVPQAIRDEIALFPED